MSLIVLLPPSEGKSDEVGTGPSFRVTCPKFARDAAPLLKRLRGLTKAERIVWYGVSTAEKATAAHKLNLAAFDAPGVSAIGRYTGVVYDFLDPTSLRDPDHAARHLFIASGMYGLIRADTPIGDYKLPMCPWLAKHWKAINTARLAACAKEATVISLLPQAHAKAVGYDPVFPIDFKLGGGKKSAGHFGKAIKGRFVRFLMEQKVCDIKDIAEFREDGYRFDGRDFIQE